VPFANRVTKVTIFGTSMQGTEEWSTGFFMGVIGDDPLPPVEAGASYIAAQWKTFFQTSAVSISSKWQFTGVKIATLNTDGTTKSDEVVYHYETTPASGVGSIHWPAQVALVATLTSDTPRGLASKGRMYLPGVASSLTDAGKLSNTTVSAVATGLKTFFDNVNDSIDATGNVILASKGSTPPLIGAPVSRPVTGLRVGDVPDTQRRRRNQLVEVYENRVVDV
jgi:hypothetical protein